MSQENVELSRRLFEEFNRAFAEGTGDLYALVDPDVEWIPVNALLEGTTYHGHDGVRQWIDDLKRDWAEFEAKPEEFLDLGDDRVLALGSWRAKGREGGVPLDIPQAAWLGEYREERLVRLQTFTERKKALEAVGLVERAMPQENAEIARRMAEAFNAGGLDAARQYYHPEIEWHEDPSFPEAGVYRGLDEVIAYNRQFVSEFEDLRYQVEELAAAGDHLVAAMQITGVGTTSGARFELSAWWAFTIRDGQVARVYAYLDKDAAFEAVGLPG